MTKLHIILKIRLRIHRDFFITHWTYILNKCANYIILKIKTSLKTGIEIITIPVFNVNWNIKTLLKN